VLEGVGVVSEEGEIWQILWCEGIDKGSIL